MTGHETAVQWLADRWLWVIFWLWIPGGFSWLWILGGFSRAGKHWRQVRRRAGRAAEIRHRRKVELERARRGLPWLDPASPDDRMDPAELNRAAGRWAQASAARHPPVVLPAAVIPAPPGARPVSGVPGPCRHERIVPVIDGDGELHRWICANYPRCDAEFDRSIAIYEPDSPS